MNHLVSDGPHAALSRSDVTRVLQRVATSFIPAFADFCLIHLADRHYLRCIAYAHGNRDGLRLLRGLASADLISRRDPLSTVAHVVRTGRAQVRNEITTHEDHAGRPYPADLLRGLAPRSAIVVPLVVRDRVRGALTLCYSASGRRYTTHHVPAAKRLARLVTGSLVRGTAVPPPAARRLPPLRARL